MSNIVIRAAQPVDASSIAAMLNQLAGDLGDADVFSSNSETIMRYGFGPEQMFHCQIATSKQGDIGFALYFKYFSTTKGQPGVYIQDLWVDPNARGNAIGEKLLEAVAVHTAQIWNAAHMKLSVHSFNTRAEQFYSRLGFSVDNGETPMSLAGADFMKLRG